MYGELTLIEQRMNLIWAISELSSHIRVFQEIDKRLWEQCKAQKHFSSFWKENSKELSIRICEQEEVDPAQRQQIDSLNREIDGLQNGIAKFGSQQLFINRDAGERSLFRANLVINMRSWPGFIEHHKNSFDHRVTIALCNLQACTPTSVSLVSPESTR
jgi:hypothetical protein